MSISPRGQNRLACAVLSTVIVAGAIALANPASVGANGPVACEGTFDTPATQPVCVVPDGVTELQVTVVGGNGGDRVHEFGPEPGGRGAAIVATLSVTPGQQLYLTVGQNGQSGDWNGAGGAYSSLAHTDASDPDNALIIAGAGGGAGARGGGDGFGGAHGSGGGDAGTDIDRVGSPGGGAATPGGVGVASGPGMGGNGGVAGSPGQDANAGVGTNLGGGGGAGYGGGSGGVSTGGGGGGGSSNGVAGTTQATSAGGGGGSGFAGGGGGYIAGGGGGSSKIPAEATVAAGDGAPRVQFHSDSPAVTKPTRPRNVKVKGGPKAKSYTLRWGVPAHGDVDLYRIWVNVRGKSPVIVKKVVGPSVRSFKLKRKKLLRATLNLTVRGDQPIRKRTITYRFRVFAINGEGVSGAGVAFAKVRI